MILAVMERFVKKRSREEHEECLQKEFTSSPVFSFSLSKPPTNPDEMIYCPFLDFMIIPLKSTLTIMFE